MDRKTVGVLGEVSAAKFYRDAGYTLLASNYRTRQGEIDLIVQGQSVLVFAEVKTRAEGSLLTPREAVTPAKQRRIVSTAAAYLEKFGSDNQPVRFDVIEVYYNDTGMTRLNCIEHAFEA
ncbi:MAG: putative endonuclease [Clostridiales bacterium]|jgi:putative endonuclease|nr:YraN family protein [Pygmaiobacter sp.]MDK2813558.1 putative endonuclease [Clostridiales bacterium]